MNLNNPSHPHAPESNLLLIAEELYFWLMRSTSIPKQHAETFRLLSQIMRIAQISQEGAECLSDQVESNCFIALSNIKEQVQDGKIQIGSLAVPVHQVLQKLIYDNPKAQLIAHATEIEYIFCIHSTYSSSCEANYQHKFKGYLKTIVDTVNSPISSTQTKAIVQVLCQIIKNPDLFSLDPHKNLSDSLQRSGVIFVDRIPNEETEIA